MNSLSRPINLQYVIVVLLERPRREDLRRYFWLSCFSACLTLRVSPIGLLWVCFGSVCLSWTVQWLKHSFDVSRYKSLFWLIWWQEIEMRSWHHTAEMVNCICIFFQDFFANKGNCVTKREVLWLCIFGRGRCLSLNTLVHKPHMDSFALV